MADNLPTVPVQTTDLSPKEVERAKAYEEAGLPGIIDINNNQIARMIDLYLGGCTYTQVCNILGIKKDIVLYLAQRHNWFEAKQEYHEELKEKIRSRVISSKLRNAEFMLLFVQALAKENRTKGKELFGDRQREFHG